MVRQKSFDRFRRRINPYPFWLLALMGLISVAAELQNSPQGLTVAGPQAAVALILTTVQDGGPAISLAPGVERITGMLGALLLLFTVNLLLGKPAVLRARKRVMQRRASPVMASTSTAERGRIASSRLTELYSRR